jgi:hypothetical protein
MGVTGFSGARQTRKHGDQWTGGGGSVVGGYLAGGETIEGGLDGRDVVEGEETLGTAAQLAGGLRTAKHEKTEDGGFVAAEAKDGAGTVLVLGDAGVVQDRDEVLVFEGVKSLTDLFFSELEHGIAAGALITGVDQRVERERITLRRGDLFFDEGSKDPDLSGVEHHHAISLHREVEGISIVTGLRRCSYRKVTFQADCVGVASVDCRGGNGREKIAFGDCHSVSRLSQGIFE